MKQLRLTRTIAITSALMTATVISAPTASATQSTPSTPPTTATVSTRPSVIPDASSLSGRLYAAVATDYCTFSPDSFFKANFKPACAAHDACYAATSSTPRLTCDIRLREALMAACTSAYGPGSMRTTCDGDAWVYYYAVRPAGRLFYKGQGSNA